MEMQKQQITKAGNRVHFTGKEDDQIRLSDSNYLAQLKQKTSKDLSQIENSKIEILLQESWDMQIVKEKLQKLVKFLRFHNVEQSQIWKRNKELPIRQFANRMNQNYRYYLSNHQLAGLLKLSTRKQCLRPKDFEPLGLWIEESDLISMNRYDYNKSSQTIKKKKIPQKRNSNQNSILNHTTLNIQVSQNEFPKLSQTFKQTMKTTKQFNKEGFKDAQKYSQAKIQLKVEQLKKDIKQSVLQKKWDFIVMAGEMNQWIEQLKKRAEKQPSQNHTQNLFSLRFKVLNKDPVQIIQQNIDIGTEEQIPHVVFIKKYQTLKKRMVKEQNNKNNLKGTVLMVLEDNDKFSKNNLINRINQRDQELNFVLLQIMRMKSMFQWQNNILKEAKINS